MVNALGQITSQSLSATLDAEVACVLSVTYQSSLGHSIAHLRTLQPFFFSRCVCYASQDNLSASVPEHR